LMKALTADIPMFHDIALSEVQGISFMDLESKLRGWARDAYEARESHLGTEVTRDLEKQILLRTIDSKWIDHLHNIELVREGIHLRGYGQRDPLQEYKKEAFGMFEQLLSSIRQESIQLFFHAQPQPPEPEFSVEELAALLGEEGMAALESADEEAITRYLQGQGIDLSNLAEIIPGSAEIIELQPSQSEGAESSGLADGQSSESSEPSEQLSESESSTSENAGYVSPQASFSSGPIAAEGNGAEHSEPAMRAEETAAESNPK